MSRSAPHRHATIFSAVSRPSAEDGRWLKTPSAPHVKWTLMCVNHPIAGAGGRQLPHKCADAGTHRLSAKTRALGQTPPTMARPPARNDPNPISDPTVEHEAKDPRLRARPGDLELEPPRSAMSQRLLTVSTVLADSLLMLRAMRLPAILPMKKLDCSEQRQLG
jgi:hypothetical protein